MRIPPRFLTAGRRAAHAAALVIVGTTLLGCVAAKLPAPTATADTIQKLRDAQLQPMRTGTFALLPGKDPGMDRRQSVRTSSVAAASGSFAQYLKDVIVIELKATGLHDEASTTVIHAQLVDSWLEDDTKSGHGRLAARFTVTRDGKKVYDKELVVEDQWESSFVGVIAIPESINRYGQSYKRLAAKLFEDPDFRVAAARRAP